MNVQLIKCYVCNKVFPNRSVETGEPNNCGGIVGVVNSKNVDFDLCSKHFIALLVNLRKIKYDYAQNEKKEA